MAVHTRGVLWRPQTREWGSSCVAYEAGGVAEHDEAGEESAPGSWDVPSLFEFGDLILNKYGDQCGFTMFYW